MFGDVVASFGDAGLARCPRQSNLAPWTSYGTVRIDEREGNLSLQLPHAPGLTARLDHWQHDTFLARFNDPSVEPILVTFTFDPDGKVAGVRMKPASPLGGFDYEDLDLRPLSSPAGG